VFYKINERLFIMKKLSIILSLLLFVQLTIPLESMKLGSYYNEEGKRRSCRLKNHYENIRTELSIQLSQNQRSEELNKYRKINLWDLPVEILERILGEVFILPLYNTANPKIFYHNFLILKETHPIFNAIIKGEYFIKSMAKKYNISPIIIAIFLKSEEIIKKFLNQSNCDLPGKFLFFAIYCQLSQDTMKLLLAKKAPQNIIDLLRSLGGVL